jgi:hypothetical protein
MRKFKFYKCVEIEAEQYFAWQSETVCGMQDVRDAQKTITDLIPTCVTEIYSADDYNMFAWLHVIFYSNEDNALFCVLIGG